MAEKISPTKTKRLSKSQRTHVRRLKQAARKAPATPHQPAKAAATPQQPTMAPRPSPATEQED